LVARQGMPQVTPEKRMALVVGNAGYKHATTLDNPINDALRMADVLDRLHFQVILVRNCDINDFNRSLRNFTRKLEGADVGLLYYSGHALQYNGENYLIPIDARLEEADDLEKLTFKLSTQLAEMRRAARVSLVFLDACRDDPFRFDEASGGAKTRRVIVHQSGLKEVDKADLKDALIAFAAEEGRTAADGEKDGLSPFTKALVEHIAMPGLEVTQMMRLVRRSVRNATKGLQTPLSSDGLTNDFFFNPHSDVTSDPPRPIVAPKHLGFVEKTYLYIVAKYAYAAELKNTNWLWIVTGIISGIISFCTFPRYGNQNSTSFNDWLLLLAPPLDVPILGYSTVHFFRV
jgi:uncharacterized caspase-like protein